MSDTLDLQKSRGRPREFDTEAALDAAMALFIERGYAAAAISDLGEAMGLTAGSIYKAFGDKRGVFAAALDRYTSTRDLRIADHLNEAATGRERLRRLIDYYAGNSHGESGRRGCLVIGSARDLALFDPDLQARIENAVSVRESLILDVIRDGQSDGSIPVHVDAEATAKAMLCLLYGMRVIGKTGRSEAEMQAIAATAMKLLD
ncbi:TetR/AcrR family transcriptional regulator [Rhizobium sp. TRM95796]|uniref:TetR/AcrR family transcriptional regulator n=1 Tax=Rhizobium sp. TRM95796 TaxID=2979862 RepID=UPI0021E76C61|nr:TetR/AcrR family transcriptional regulator [Rhizobium sp. TRM95796]MCV3764518.1 TetR/AcrR family transcriptional regulator [Rhizobium sp. TRM95796]